MQMKLPEGSQRVVDADHVRAGYDRMAVAVNAHYADVPVLLLAVMNGGMVAAVHLAERLTMPLTIDYLHVTRYRGETRGGTLHWIARPQHDLAERHVLVVDDILDVGTTLAAIIQHCVDAGAASVRSAVLVEKAHERRIPGVRADFVGLTVEDRYIFGCGMDYREGYRHLPEIWAIEE